MELTEGAGRTEESSGLERLVHLPGATCVRCRNGRWHGYFCRVYVITGLLSVAIGPVIQGWPFLIRNARVQRHRRRLFDLADDAFLTHVLHNGCMAAKGKIPNEYKTLFPISSS